MISCLNDVGDGNLNLCPWREYLTYQEKRQSKWNGVHSL